MILAGVAVAMLAFLAAVILYHGRKASDIALVSGIALIALIEIFDQMTLHGAGDPYLCKKAVIFLESLVPIAFLAFGVSYARKGADRFSYLPWVPMFSLALLFTACVFLFPLEDFYRVEDLQIGRMLALGPVGYWFFIGLMFLSIMALMNLEATFASTSGLDRWRIKFEFAGVASILAVLILYFSQGLLYRSINMHLVPIREGMLIVAAVMIAYSRLSRGGSVKVVVSRYMFYRSFTLLAVGLYLLSLGLVGEGLRYLRISFSRDLTVLIAFLSGIALFLILFSEELRRRIKVSISKHFYRHKHDYRGQWMGFSEALSRCRTMNDVQEAVAAKYSEAFGLRYAVIYFPDHRQDKFRRFSGKNLEDMPEAMPVSQPLREYFLQRRRVLNTADGEYPPDPEERCFLEEAEVWLVVPLAGRESLEGLVVMGKSLADEELTYEDYDLMKAMAQQAAPAVASRRLSEELAEARELSAMAKVSSFVVHDLKNLAYSLSLILDNVEGYMSEPDFQKDMIKSIRLSVVRMNELIQKLKSIPEKYTLHPKSTDLDALIRETVRDMRGPRPSTAVRYQGESINVWIDPLEIRKVLVNLLLNALDATGEDGEIEVKLGRQDGTILFTVRDNGCGISSYFIKNHLFKPFRTTKDKGLGIGLYQCRQIIEAHGGVIDVSSEVGRGTVFSVCLPANEGRPGQPAEQKDEKGER